MDKIRELAKQFTVSDPADIDVYRNELERNEGILREWLREFVLEAERQVEQLCGDLQAAATDYTDLKRAEQDGWVSVHELIARLLIDFVKEYADANGWELPLKKDNYADGAGDFAGYVMRKWRELPAPPGPAERRHCIPVDIERQAEPKGGK